MNKGWLTLGKLRGAPIRVHWTLLVGAVVWSRFTFAPAFWLGFAVLILVHELGHALVVLRYSLGLSEIALHGAGGYCRHDNHGTRFQEALVAWGGVLAQLTAYAALHIGVAVWGWPREPHLAQFLYVFDDTNLWIAALNLVPIEPLDGAKAWPLVGMLVARWRRDAKVPPRRRSVQDELRSLEKLDTRGETPDQRTDRLVRDLISRTTQPKDR